MSKDWEYDFLELLRVYDGKIPDDLVIFVRALLANQLKEVREKVIEEGLCIYNAFCKTKQYQLKKLKELEKEGK